VSVSGGNLVLEAVAAVPQCHAATGEYYDFRSGLVETANHFTFSSGTLSARIWTEPGSGPIVNWPAFWADGTGTWPQTGELDVFEGLSGRPCFHFHSPSGGPGGCASGGSGWHVYSATWGAGTVTYSYDGVQVGQITSGITSAPMFLILDLGISSPGHYGGDLSVPATMLVDWVRVSS